jgi:hypothetical protein
MHPISAPPGGEMRMPRPFIPANLAAQRRRPQTASHPTPRLGAVLRPAETPRRDVRPEAPPPRREPR